MEITNDNYFNIKYNTELDRIEVRKKNKFMEKIQRHKIVSTIVTILIMFFCLDFFLICSFIKLIESI